MPLPAVAAFNGAAATKEDVGHDAVGDEHLGAVQHVRVPVPPRAACPDGRPRRSRPPGLGHPRMAVSCSPPADGPAGYLSLRASRAGPVEVGRGPCPLWTPQPPWAKAAQRERGPLLRRARAVVEEVGPAAAAVLLVVLDAEGKPKSAPCAARWDFGICPPSSHWSTLRPTSFGRKERNRLAETSRAAR